MASQTTRNHVCSTSRPRLPPPFFGKLRSARLMGQRLRRRPISDARERTRARRVWTCRLRSPIWPVAFSPVLCPASWKVRNDAQRLASGRRAPGKAITALNNPGSFPHAPYVAAIVPETSPGVAKNIAEYPCGVVVLGTVRATLKTPADGDLDVEAARRSLLMHRNAVMASHAQRKTYPMPPRTRTGGFCPGHSGVRLARPVLG
ncbi:hypothetical protein C8Q77DRAFT_121255 [Trametes polyzona]|nr:hypothetical protein C8Q77DRAFT_121255 [Trametes polyzona]